MHNMAKVPIPPERIHSTTLTGQPKSDILKDLQQQHPGALCHFVEDKLATLEKVSSGPGCCYPARHLSGTSFA